MWRDHGPDKNKTCAWGSKSLLLRLRDGKKTAVGRVGLRAVRAGTSWSKGVDNERAAWLWRGWEESCEVRSALEQGVLGRGTQQTGRLLRAGHQQSILKTENVIRLLSFLIKKDHSQHCKVVILEDG